MYQGVLFLFFLKHETSFVFFFLVKSAKSKSQKTPKSKSDLFLGFGGV